MARSRKKSPSDQRRRTKRELSRAKNVAVEIRTKLLQQQKAADAREFNLVACLESDIRKLRTDLNVMKGSLIAMGLAKQQVPELYRPDLAAEMRTNADGASLRTGPKRVMPPEAARMSGTAKRGWVDTRGQGLR